MAAKAFERLVLSRREFFHRRALSGSGGNRSKPGNGGGRPAAGFPVALARRRVPALLRGALPPAGALHLRRTGIGALALAPDRVSETAPPHGALRHHPGDYGDPRADADGLSGCAALTADEGRAGPDQRRGDGPFSA